MEAVHAPGDGHRRSGVHRWSAGGAPRGALVSNTRALGQGPRLSTVIATSWLKSASAVVPPSVWHETETLSEPDRPTVLMSAMVRNAPAPTLASMESIEAAPCRRSHITVTLAPPLLNTCILATTT